MPEDLDEYGEPISPDPNSHDWYEGYAAAMRDIEATRHFVSKEALDALWYEWKKSEMSDRDPAYSFYQYLLKNLGFIEVDHEWQFEGFPEPVATRYGDSPLA